MARSDGVSGMDPVSCKFLGGSTWQLDTCHPHASQILTTTDAPCFPTCQSLRKGSRGSNDTQMDYQYLKTHYDACRQRSVRQISQDHSGSFGINCGLHTSILDVTSGSQISEKVVSCISSKFGVIITRIVGFYGLTVMIDLLPLLMIENVGMWPTFQGLKI